MCRKRAENVSEPNWNNYDAFWLVTVLGVQLYFSEACGNSEDTNLTD